MPRRVPSRFDLPIEHRRFLAAEAGGARNPKHGGAEKMVRGHVVEEMAGFADDCSHIEAVRHDQKDVHVVWRGFVGDEGTEEDET